ncbi:leucine-rich repeat and immunoglobulin-like domain-containing nogo receptor-interacting protein 1 [Anguilla anguilla]|uniref:leucine-rich repeat and immunoglobulin-like domain-containing nogo receptor-interacting protein 1 n=1 Tax=Anguilla anguilla TaxID=7936 RepID=UPI0015B1A127|nr:leucine-rich repeat and immunoglobulin-like domain-containing nogo receptor-interacting protein 1 [Anguilla anguilla]
MFVESVVRWGSWSALLLWVGVATGGTPASSSPWPCPPRCSCHQERLEANCSSQHLSSVPEGFPRDTRLLDLSRNRLKTLARRGFLGLSQLRQLDLSANVLSMIEVEAFQGLPGLQTLLLGGNRLKILPVGAFSGLPGLRLLDLSRNEILVFLDHTFRELGGLRRLEAGENDLVFVSPRAFSGLAGLAELELDRCNLTSVPTEALSQLQGLWRLRFRRLSLGALPNDSFRGLGRLRELSLSQCPRLSALAPNSLLGLNLTSLTVARCNLTSVPYAAVRHLVYLRHLDLSHNPIAVVRAHLLGDLLRLQELHLVGAGLLRVEPGAFRGLARFRLLNVSANRLSTLEEAAFHAVGSLETLRLDGNPLACDCRLLWVVRRRLRLDFDGRPPACHTPVRAQGRGFRGLSEAELPGLFTCRPARILNRKPQEARVEEGHTALFSCRADGDPAPAISWLTPQLAPLSPTGRVRVLPDGSLEVRYAQVQDSGTYLCVAANAAGNQSFSVGLHVRGFSSSSSSSSFSSSSRNRSSAFFSEGWAPPSGNPAPANGSAQGAGPFPFDGKTLVIAVTMGSLSFLSSVVICFVFMFFWSRSKGQLKHTATIDFVPRPAGGASRQGGDRFETGRFTMKLI